MCPDCEARRRLARDAFLNAKIKEAVGHVAKGTAEAVGLKKKTGVVEAREKPRPKRAETKDSGAAG
ncbi:hypothetical protein ACSBPU_05575 [Parapusillimonas sp. JC17]|uniref:hypothetical protein n=1 Tax=Parapusillimonas sp. JC17 TaxID=3445768 RepID=UPI003F9F6363